MSHLIRGIAARGCLECRRLISSATLRRMGIHGHHESGCREQRESFKIPRPKMNQAMTHERYRNFRDADPNNLKESSSIRLFREKLDTAQNVDYTTVYGQAFVEDILRSYISTLNDQTLEPSDVALLIKIICNSYRSCITLLLAHH